MGTVVNIPDTMYQRIKAQSAEEGQSIQSITLVLYSQWLGDSQPVEHRGLACRRRAAKPDWFESLKVDKSLAVLMALSGGEGISFSTDFTTAIKTPNILGARPGSVNQMLVPALTSNGLGTFPCDKSFRRLPEIEAVV